MRKGSQACFRGMASGDRAYRAIQGLQAFPSTPASRASLASVSTVAKCLVVRTDASQCQSSHNHASSGVQTPKLRCEFENSSMTFPGMNKSLSIFLSTFLSPRSHPLASVFAPFFMAICGTRRLRLQELVIEGHIRQLQLQGVPRSSSFF